jgi:hypothetical protein
MGPFDVIIALPWMGVVLTVLLRLPTHRLAILVKPVAELLG